MPPGNYKITSLEANQTKPTNQGSEDDQMTQGYMLVPLEASCQLCGTDIIKDHPRRIHCESCAILQTKSKKLKWKREHYKKKTIVKLCKLCITPYVASDQHKSYCSKACFDDNQKIVRYEKRIIELQLKIFELRGTRN